jgi:hypothetical protein
MDAIERKPGFDAVVECRRRQVSEIRSASRVFGVTRNAFVLHIAVDARLLRDAIGNRLMTHKAARGSDALTRLVTLLAIARAFERRVCLRQRPR